MFPRSSGILLHISSLPGPFGIGTMGRSAREFVDFLQRAGQSYWQILPLVPIGPGYSPYLSVSSAAGNALLIDPEDLAEMGLLTRAELEGALVGHPDQVDFPTLCRDRIPLLRRAFERCDDALRAKTEAFAEANRDWLSDYALFMACMDRFGVAFYDWPDPALIRREADALARWREELREDVAFHVFLQHVFFDQWQRLRTYANEHGVGIIGDIPFYVSGNSVDVWTHPEFFVLDENFRPRLVGGVPPDLYSDEGQLWGSPLYDWPVHASDGFAWWCGRIRQSMAFYDVIRIDHFRGIHSYWEVPAGAASAREGVWREGPGEALLAALRTEVPEAEFIAEDLGDLSPEAVRFVRSSGLPGMRVLTDAFHDPGGGSDFLPHRCVEDAVMYTGTHDNPTFLQWLHTIATEEQRRFAFDYLRLNEQEGESWGVIAGAWGCVCRLAVATFQDVLGLGGDARMNTPGTVGDQNWTWRVRREAINNDVAGRLYRLTQIYGRLPAFGNSGRE